MIVEGEYFAPRERIVSALFAIEAENANTVDGAEAADLEESVEITDAVAAHTAMAHHEKTTSFTELTDEATDAQIPDSITINNADMVDGAEAADLEESVEITDAVAAHTAMAGAHHEKTTSFTELTDTATDAQIPDDITISEDAPQVGDNTENYIPKWDGTALVSGSIYEDGDGRVGIGTTIPQSHLHVNSSTSGAGIRIVGQAGTYEDTASLTLASAEPDRKMWIMTHKSNNELLYQYSDGTGWIFPLVLSSEGNVGIGTRNPQEKLDVDGTTRTEVLRITGGSDIAEPFNIKESENIKPGMVLSIAPDNPGKLKLSDKAYDRCVAGIASGAGGIKPGITLTQEGSFDGTHNVALTGRVYGLCDASYGSIQPGDLLTTSPMPGYAMKVNDYEKAQGAVLGKAMTKLEEGKGLVLVLVSLQ